MGIITGYLKCVSFLDGEEALNVEETKLTMIITMLMGGFLDY